MSGFLGGGGGGGGGPGSDTTAIHDDVAAEISALTTVTPENADVILIEDSSDSFSKKKVLASNFLTASSDGLSFADIDDYAKKTLLDSYATTSHAATHIKDGSNEVDGDQLDIDFNPTHYTPDTSPSEVSDVDHLSAHLAGLDNYLLILGNDIASASTSGLTYADIDDYAKKSLLDSYLALNSLGFLDNYLTYSEIDNYATKSLLDSYLTSAVVDNYLTYADIDNYATKSLLDSYATTSHASAHITSGSDEIDGDQLDIDFNPTNYVPTTSPSEVSNVDHLTAHLAGVDDYLGDLTDILVDRAEVEGYVVLNQSSDPTSLSNAGSLYTKNDSGDAELFYIDDSGRITQITKDGELNADEFAAHASSHISSGTDEIDGDQLDIDFNPTHYVPTTSPTEASSVDHLTAHLAGIDNYLIDLGNEDEYQQGQLTTINTSLVNHIDDTSNPHSVTADQLNALQYEDIDQYALKTLLDNYAQLPLTVLDSYAITSHASTHITSGSDEIDGDQLDIDWNPTHYAPTTSPSEASNVDHLTAHLAGIDNYLLTLGNDIDTNAFDPDAFHDNIAGEIDSLDLVDAAAEDLLLIEDGSDGYAKKKILVADVLGGGGGGSPDAHASTHIDGGSDPIDGDKLEISWAPTHYTRDTSPAEADSTDDLTAHLAGIDNYLGGITSLSVDSAAVGTYVSIVDDNHRLEFGDTDTGIPTTDGFAVRALDNRPVILQSSRGSGSNNISCISLADVNTASINDDHIIHTFGWVNNADTFIQKFQIKGSGSIRLLGSSADITWSGDNLNSIGLLGTDRPASIYVGTKVDIDGYLSLRQTSDPGALIDVGSLYSKNVDGYAELHYIDDYGNVIQLTDAGSAAGGGGGGASGWTDDGAIVRLTTASDSVAIGTASLFDSEKIRIIGDAVLEQMDWTRHGTTGDSSSKDIDVQLTAETTSDAYGELTRGDVADDRITLSNNQAMAFTAYISAYRTDTTGEAAGYKFEGVIRRDATAGSTTLVESSKTVLGEDTAAWDAYIQADTTNGALSVWGIGENSKTIRWTCFVKGCLSS